MTMTKSIPVDASSGMLEGYENKSSNCHHEKHAPKRLFEFKKSIPKPLTIVLGLAVWVIFFGAWQLSSALGLVNELLFPAPTEVVAALYNLLANQGFITDIGVSLYRILVSFLIACAVAIPLGILMGCFKAVEAFFGPFVSAWRYLPAPALIPLLLMWLGAGEEQKLALLVLGVIWFLITLISDHTKTVRAELIETAVTLGGSRIQVLKTVVIPAVMPDILVVMRQMMAVSWTYLVIAEIVAADSGIGAMMMRAKRFIHVDEIMAGILVIGVLGLLLDLLLRLAHRMLFPYLDDHRK